MKTVNKKQKLPTTDKAGVSFNPLLSAGWIEVGKQLPEIGKPILILTDYGKMDVCRLRIEESRVIVWVNDMRPEHTDGSVTHWMPLPACR